MKHNEYGYKVLVKSKFMIKKYGIIIKIVKQQSFLEMICSPKSQFC